MQSENYSHYATIEDTFDLKAMEHYTTVSEPHYAEPLQSDSLHDDTETNPSFPETRKTAVNRNVQNQGFQQDLLKLCKSNYHENMNQMESQQSQESYISDIHKHRTCDSRLLRHSEYSSEYFQLEPKDMNDDNINQENNFSPKNEYFQLEVSSKGTKKHVNEIEDQIILGSESNECSTHCAQDISEATTPMLSVNEHLNSSTNFLTSMTDLQRTNDESSLIMQTEGNTTDNRSHKCHMESRSNAPDDGSGYFVLLKRKDFPDQQ
ncbi:hypothetical protein FSP39_001701 [Pinctada imbricata]|uniref:Uncharacterized protein n=1 Tax=Pinctada imbricata TaxID=66713 RepID=A0AA89BS08_PINIB|nr:hypothetical protein FSP39_001701 [Pinctada imbricata]